MTMPGRLFGVGLGPGDPELITMKAARVLGAAPIVAFFAKTGHVGNARQIADRWMPKACEELLLAYPLTTELPYDHPHYIAQLSAFYEESARTIATRLEAGQDVALLAEGDPLFYGSFMHLYIRLRARYPATVVPGVTGMAGCWSVAGAPMTWGDDTMSVLPGTLSHDGLVEKLRATDAAVIMKLGRNFAKVREAVDEAGMLGRAIYVERGTMADELVMPLAEKLDGKAPYFSLILIPGQGRRP
jgi:precorrin-2/cobalt-factor-2 C20-methyltransferase